MVIEYRRLFIIAMYLEVQLDSIKSIFQTLDFKSIQKGVLKNTLSMFLTVNRNNVPHTYLKR